ncbi:LOW QUALITY PROTEIN: 60S acidic ribosomal protein P0-like [Paramacrobiotus metropolitanus]|uniref:LOW QUALITY PROTEIN: 60S acidic ribosomal protein P0-like n=1 Tax=Paramacrobiotus metropolitanus TaxID=2943436 RepID=UPI002445C075|nr:LOW QUALITY PROTEIN: 60S acidic ribosomal protein P0-like [Paramacrobiotus metropolitanus]
MVREDRTSWKAKYFTKIAELFEEYPKCFVVGVDNVGSKQMQQIRTSLRGHAVVLNGKNTMIRKALRGKLEANPGLEKLLPHVKENIGFVFTKGDLAEIRDLLLQNKVAAPAKAGALAPVDVRVPPQNTGLGPEKTSFFQALQIPTKIAKGTIEILTEVHLIKQGDKVGASEATLLNMLKIFPFSYGLIVRQVYDNGSTYEPGILDITPEVLRAKFMEGVSHIAALSLGVGYPTKVSAPHSILNGFKNLVAVAAESDLSFKQAEKMLEILKDPAKFAAASAAAASSKPAAAPAAAAAKEEKKAPAKEEKEEEDDGGFGGLFD